MGGLELILIALLPLALLAALPDSRSDDGDSPGAEDRAPDQDDSTPNGDLLDLATEDIVAPAPAQPPAPDTRADALRPMAPASDPASDPATDAEPPETPPPGEGPVLRAGATLAEGGSPGASDTHPPAGAPTLAASGTPSLTDAANIAAGSPEFAGYLSPSAVLGSAGADNLQAPPAGAAVFANGLDGTSTAGNRLDGGAGNDTLLGGAGADTLAGTAGENVIHASYDPNLEIAQGSDLFSWRDNGAPDLLEGGSDSDRLVFARGDTATGGGGSNVFEVWHDPHSPQPAAVITDFTPGQDRLDIVIRIDEADHPDCGAWAWDRQVQASVFEGATPSIFTDPENDRTEIRLGDETLARLLGTPPLTPADLRLFAFWDITT